MQREIKCTTSTVTLQSAPYRELNTAQVCPSIQWNKTAWISQMMRPKLVNKLWRWWWSVECNVTEKWRRLHWTNCFRWNFKLDLVRLLLCSTFNNREVSCPSWGVRDRVGNWKVLVIALVTCTWGWVVGVTIVQRDKGGGDNEYD